MIRFALFAALTTGASAIAQAPTSDDVMRAYAYHIEWVRDSGGNGNTCMTAQGEKHLDELVAWLAMRATLAPAPAPVAPAKPRAPAVTM